MIHTWKAFCRTSWPLSEYILTYPELKPVTMTCSSSVEQWPADLVARGSETRLVNSSLSVKVMLSWNTGLNSFLPWLYLAFSITNLKINFLSEIGAFCGTNVEQFFIFYHIFTYGFSPVTMTQRYETALRWYWDQHRLQPVTLLLHLSRPQQELSNAGQWWYGHDDDARISWSSFWKLMFCM